MHRLFRPKIIAYVLALVAFDFCIAPVFRIGGGRIFLSYLLIVYAAFQWGWQRTIPMAVMIGILRDLLSTGLIGAETLALVLSSLLLDVVVQKMQRENWLLRMSASAGFVLSAVLLQILVSGMLTGLRYHFGYQLVMAIGSAVYSSALAPIFFYVSAKWFKDQTVIKQYDLFHS